MQGAGYTKGFTNGAGRTEGNGHTKGLSVPRGGTCEGLDILRDLLRGWTHCGAGRARVRSTGKMGPNRYGLV